MLGQIAKNRLVSPALPGPTISFQLPSPVKPPGSIIGGPEVLPFVINTALLRSGASVPSVRYAIVTSGSTVPLCRWKSLIVNAFRSASAMSSNPVKEISEHAGQRDGKPAPSRHKQ